MPTYDAVVVFGSKLQAKDGKFPAFVYDELDRAVTLQKRYSIPRIVVCGSHSMNHGRRDLPRECDVAEAYLAERFPNHGIELWKEGRSTSIPENWLYLRLLLADAGMENPRLLVVTIPQLLSRMYYLSQKILHGYASVAFEMIVADSVFPREEMVLGDTKCILKDMMPGDYRFLLDETGVSRWEHLRTAHHTTCPFRGHLHPF